MGSRWQTDKLAAERLMKSPAVQKRVHNLMAQGLILWREGLDLEDVQIELILSHLRAMIHKFEEKEYLSNPKMTVDEIEP